MISMTVAFMVGGICVLLQAFFSGSEICLVSVNRERLRQRADDGDRGARLAEAFLAQPQLLLATTLIGTNLCLFAFAVTMALALVGAKGGSGELYAVLFVTPMTLILGEVIPKTLFQHFSDVLAPRIVYPLQLFSLALRPVVWVFASIASAVSRLFGTEGNRAFVTREELTLLIEPEIGTRSEITKDEREMISNVLELSEAVVLDVMVPLSEVTALPEETSLSEAIHEVSDKRHSRMPVYRSRVDDIVGVLHVFDLLQARRAGRQASAGMLARPATFVPGNRPAVELLFELKGTGNQMAVVVDEYGGAVGVVTVEDILEEIVGEIHDEYDDSPPPIRQERPGVWRAEARIPVSRVNEEIGAELPEGDAYESLGGLMLDHFKRIPEAGESVVIGIVTLRVVKANGRAIEEIQILRRKR